MHNTLNIEKLARLVRAKRGASGLRIIAQAITEEFGDMSVSTLSRVENGRVPDMETFLRLCDWLKVPAGELLMVEGHDEQSESTFERVVTLLRADRNLEPAIAQALVEVIRAVYRGRR